MIHAAGDGFSLCGLPDQPEIDTRDDSKVTCDLCLKIIAEFNTPDDQAHQFDQETEQIQQNYENSIDGFDQTWGPIR